jgi:alpha-galactosidase
VTSGTGSGGRAFTPPRPRVLVKYRVGRAAGELAVALDPDRSGDREIRAENADLVLAIQVEHAAHRTLGLDPAGAADALVVSTAVTARRDDLRLDLVEPLELRAPGLDPADLRLLHNGWQSWSGTSALAGDAAEPRPPTRLLREVTTSPWAPRTRGAGHLSSELFTAAVDARTGRGVVLGYLGAASQFGGFELASRAGGGPRLVARLPFEGVPLARGETRHGEPLLAQWGDDVPGMLAAWAALLGHDMHARIPTRRSVGWCSWYEYFTRIDAGVIERNLDAAAALRDRLPVELFQIDDGYQAAIGDWLETNARFPHGLAPLTRAIVERGFEPGLWLAPFIARPESTLAREHPGWLVRDAVGRPRRGVFNPAWGWRDSAWALDLSHPGALEWLAATCARLVGELGLRFLKLDFLYAAALPGRRRDPRLTGAEVLRRGLETIRSAVGEEVHLLGCGCPLGPAVGVVDSMRIGADVAPFWRDALSRGPGRDYDFPSARNALRNTMARSFLHGRLWRNDPDCLLVRDRRTKLGYDEVVALATVIAVSGGTLLLSDELSGLAGPRLWLAARACEVQRDLLDEAPVCLDLLEGPFARFLLARARCGRAYLAALNPTDAPAPIALRLDGSPAVRRALGGLPTAAREVWTDEVLALSDGVLDLGVVAPHGARLVQLSAASADR